MDPTGNKAFRDHVMIESSGMSRRLHHHRRRVPRRARSGERHSHHRRQRRLRGDAAWRVEPDASRMMESLASAVVARDGALFDAGESNLDWRRHAPFEPEGESE
jgi:hypothetical protein